MAEEIEDVRKKIASMHKKIEEITYYEVFDVDAGLDQALLDDRVTDQFRQLARQWHVDRYNAYDLEEGEREQLQEIFSFINTAKQVLSDPDKRAGYDMELAGDNTDIGSILTAESAFRRGQNMLETGSYDGAHEQFRIAVENNEDDKEYQAHYLYTEFLQIPKNADGQPLKKTRAQEIYDALDEILADMPERDWLLTFLGVVAKALNRTREAEGLFNEALQHNSRNVTAQRELRLLKMRKGQKKGFFEQIKAKLGLS